MAVQDDFVLLQAEHLYDFDGDAVDFIGTVNGTNSGCIFTDAAIAVDATNCMTTNGLTDRVTLATTANINNSAQSRKAVAGWFMPTAFQAPPTRIYGEGNQTTAFQICMGFGNNVVFECIEPTNFPTGLQIFGPSLLPNRAYHLCAIFLGNAQGNEIKFFVDGIEQFNADPLDRQPDTASLDARGVAEFGDPAGTTGLGGAVVLQQAARNGKYQHWATWGDIAAADLSDEFIRVGMFERQALAGATIATGSESAMQAALDALPTSQGNLPCCVEVNEVTGGGDFTLTSDLTFDELASIHFRYNGDSGTLTIVNVSGGNASIGASPVVGGEITIATRQTLTVTVLDAGTKSAISGARVYIVAAAGGALAVDTVIMNAVTNASGVATATFDYSADQPISGWVRKHTSSTFYGDASIGGTLESTPLNTTVLMVSDE